MCRTLSGHASLNHEYSKTLWKLMFADSVGDERPACDKYGREYRGNDHYLLNRAGPRCMAEPSGISITTALVMILTMSGKDHCQLTASFSSSLSPQATFAATAGKYRALLRPSYNCRHDAEGLRGSAPAHRRPLHQPASFPLGAVLTP
jgi:hypothetical protein